MVAHRYYSQLVGAYIYNGARYIFIAGGSAAESALIRYGLATEAARNFLLNQVTDPILKGVVNQLYRPGANIGNGGTADAARAELAKTTFQNSPHAIKAVERMSQLTDQLSRGLYDGRNREIAIQLLRELESAIPKEFWNHTYRGW